MAVVADTVAELDWDTFDIGSLKIGFLAMVA